MQEQAIEDLIRIIKNFEGFSPVPYICPGGVSTIGYGHIIKASESFTEITTDEALEILTDDITKVGKVVRRNISVPLSIGQYYSLISLVFNIGAGAFQRSTLRQKLNRKEYNMVPEEMRRWVWSGGKKLRGLIIRREMEIMLWHGITLQAPYYIQQSAKNFQQAL